MDEYRENTTEDKREEIKRKLRQYYDGRIVRKDLTKSIPMMTRSLKREWRT